MYGNAHMKSDNFPNFQRIWCWFGHVQWNGFLEGSQGRRPKKAYFFELCRGLDDPLADMDACICASFGLAKLVLGCGARCSGFTAPFACCIGWLFRDVCCWRVNDLSYQAGHSSERRCNFMYILFLFLINKQYLKNLFSQMTKLSELMFLGQWPELMVSFFESFVSFGACKKSQVGSFVITIRTFVCCFSFSWCIRVCCSTFSDFGLPGARAHPVSCAGWRGRVPLLDAMQWSRYATGVSAPACDAGRGLN